MELQDYSSQLEWLVGSESDGRLRGDNWQRDIYGRSWRTFHRTGATRHLRNALKRHDTTVGIYTAWTKSTPFSFYRRASYRLEEIIFLRVRSNHQQCATLFDVETFG